MTAKVSLVMIQTACFWFSLGLTLISYGIFYFSIYPGDFLSLLPSQRSVFTVEIAYGSYIMVGNGSFAIFSLSLAPLFLL